MEFAATIHTEALIEHLHRLETLIREDSIKNVAETHMQIILSLTAQGKDYMGNPFRPYSKGHAAVRAREGYPLTPKNLRMSQGRLQKLSLQGNTLSVAADEETQKIALGQNTGADGRWSYRNRFMDVTTATNRTAEENLAAHLRSRL